MNSISFILIPIFMATMSCGISIPDLNGYYQDLTGPIDTIVFGNDKTNFTHQNLKDALNRSTNVFYSTDMRMNNIMDLIPVIKLLNDTKPEKSIRVSILLSLKFTYKNRFSRPEYDDVYYDLTHNFTKDSWRAIFGAVDYIAIDMTTEDCTEASFFYSQPGSWLFDQPLRNFSFPYYVKNFISFYKQSLQENQQILVGLAYNSSQIGCADYLRDQINTADFFMIIQEFPLYEGFPYTEKALRITSEQLQKKNHDAYMKQREHFRFCEGNKKFFYILQTKIIPTTTDILSEWSYTMRNLVSSSSFYSQIFESMIERSHWTNLELLISRRSDSALSRRRSQCMYVLGNSVTAQISRLSTEDTPPFKASIAIPTIITSERHFDYCNLQSGLSKVRNGSFVVDQETWRAMARYESTFFRSDYCRRHNNYNQKTMSGSQALLVFQHGISKEWPKLGKNMNLLVKKHRNIANLTLNTILFHEDDILPSKGNEHSSTDHDSGHDQILEFLRKWDGVLSTGCVVNFTEDRIKSVDERSGRFSEKMGTLCEPVFDMVDLLIWNIQGLTDENEYDVNHNAVILARELFLAEFPEKQVFLRLDSEIEYDVVTEWSRLYGVPTIFKN